MLESSDSDPRPVWKRAMSIVPGLLAAVLCASAAAEDAQVVDPYDARPGTLCAWHAADGLPYEYFVPATYDPAVGANLTLVLHGNGLDQRWTFFNHPAGQFRAADIVVSPEGTTFTKGTNANEFLGTVDDAKRLHELITELKKVWNVKQVFLYGHSQGSFFVFYYAGLFPDEVDGVCGHSSGVWNWTTTGTKGRHQAIGLMHGTLDGNVPYGQSWWGRKYYEETAKYPLVHLRTLFDWGHQPNWRQAELQLAWCEGMTSEDAARLAACLQTLGAPDVPLGTDWSALWAVADRLAQLKAATDDQRALAAGVAKKVDELAARHIAAVETSLGKGGAGSLKKLPSGPAAGHLIRLLEEFHGVPALEPWARKNQATLKALSETAQSAYDDYQRNLTGDPKKAFGAGLTLLESGWIHYDLPAVLKRLDKLAAGDDVKVSDADRKKLTALGDAYRASRKDGFAECAQLNADVQPLAP